MSPMGKKKDGEIQKYFGQRVRELRKQKDLSQEALALAPKIPKELLLRIAEVTNKRARFVLDSIAKNSLVTTEEINRAGTTTRHVPHRTSGISAFV
jgi:ribosome-binding protein aMBF1 (putative translation factor)